MALTEPLPKGWDECLEPDPAEQVARYGADPPVRDWVRRLVCSQCGSRSVDFVLTGTRR